MNQHLSKGVWTNTEHYNFYEGCNDQNWCVWLIWGLAVIKMHEKNKKIQRAHSLEVLADQRVLECQWGLEDPVEREREVWIRHGVHSHVDVHLQLYTHCFPFVSFAAFLSRSSLLSLWTDNVLQQLKHTIPLCFTDSPTHTDYLIPVISWRSCRACSSRHPYRSLISILTCWSNWTFLSLGHKHKDSKGVLMYIYCTKMDPHFLHGFLSIYTDFYFMRLKYCRPAMNCNVTDK